MEWTPLLGKRKSFKKFKIEPQTAAEALEARKTKDNLLSLNEMPTFGMFGFPTVVLLNGVPHCNSNEETC